MVNPHIVKLSWRDSFDHQEPLKHLKKQGYLGHEDEVALHPLAGSLPQCQLSSYPGSNSPRKLEGGVVRHLAQDRQRVRNIPSITAAVKPATT